MARKQRRAAPRTAPIPSQEEIREQCERIQSRWSDRVRQKRMQCPRTPWTPPVIGIETLRFAIKSIEDENDD